MQENMLQTWNMFLHFNQQKCFRFCSKTFHNKFAIFRTCWRHSPGAFGSTMFSISKFRSKFQDSWRWRGSQWRDLWSIWTKKRRWSKKLRHALNQVRSPQPTVMLQERKATFIIMFVPLLDKSCFVCRCPQQTRSKNILKCSSSNCISCSQNLNIHTAKCLSRNMLLFSQGLSVNHGNFWRKNFCERPTLTYKDLCQELLSFRSIHVGSGMQYFNA